MNALRSQAGYTMAELLVATAVIGMILAGLLSLLMTGQQSFTVGMNRVEAQQTARLALTRLSEDVRTGGYDPKNTAAFAAITALTPPNVGFTISNDWNATGAIETNVTTVVNGTTRGEQITYSVVGNTLSRQESMVDGATVPVTDALSGGVTLRYLDVDDAVVLSPHVATNAATIRTVEITIVTTPDQQASTGLSRVAVTSTIRARVRNRT